MRPWLSSSGLARAVGVSAVYWLCGLGAAWAGGGGESLGAILPDALPVVCTLAGQSPCPQFPTFSQFALEIAGLHNAPIEFVRSAGDAPDPAANAGNPPLPSAPDLSNPPLTLQNLSALAFMAPTTPGQPTAPASPLQIYSSTDTFFADTFFYAVASQASGQPDTLNLIYDDLSATTQSFTKGQNVAAMSVPLAILNKNNTETPVPTIVEIVAGCTGGTSCLTANAVGDFAGNGNLQTKSASSVGINFVAAFGPSAVSTHAHLIFELQVPLLVTMSTDSPYFWEATHLRSQPYPPSPIVGTTFSSNDLGTKLSGSQIGMVPAAVPLCNKTTCPSTGTAPPGVYSFCARLPKNGAPPPGIVTAVSAFYAIAVDGEALLSAPINPKDPIVCPAFPF